jgi:hypothetical protein
MLYKFLFCVFPYIALCYIDYVPKQIPNSLLCLPSKTENLKFSRLSSVIINMVIFLSHSLSKKLKKNVRSVVIRIYFVIMYSESRDSEVKMNVQC